MIARGAAPVGGSSPHGRAGFFPVMDADGDRRGTPADATVGDRQT
jgi:hypothetical protein